METSNVPPQPTSQLIPPSKAPHNSSKTSIVLGIVIGLFIGALIFGGFYIWKTTTNNQHEKKTDMSNQTDEQKDKKDTDVSKNQKSETDTTTLAKLDKYTVQVMNDINLKDFTKSLEGKDVNVQWLKGAKPLDEEQITDMLAQIKPDQRSQIKARQDICKLIKEKEDYPPTYCDIYIFKAGKLTAPIERDLYYVMAPVSEMGTYWETHVSFFDTDYKKFITLLPSDTTFSPWHEFGQDYFEGFATTDAVKIAPPKTLQIPGQKSILKFEQYLSLDQGPQNIFNPTGTPENKGGILDIRNKEIAHEYHKDLIAFTDKDYGPVYFKDKSYQLFLPDGSVAQYDLLPYFFQVPENQDAEKTYYTNGFKTTINFDIPSHNEELYELSGTIIAGGCFSGIEPCTNIVNNEDWFKWSEKTQIGRTSEGEPVYELADKKTNPYYKELFEYGFDMGYGLYKTTTQDELNALSDEYKYDRFLEDQPLFFWQDPDGNWRVYKKQKYMSSAECGKPVIYLYPESDMNVNVQVQPNGGFSITEPQYGEDGWNVYAKTDGTLTNLSDNTQWPYLFWEGQGNYYEMPEQGFVMARNDVHTRMHELLTKQGLIEKEINDFMEFWQPRLEKSPYVYVTFLPQPYFEKIAPLTVTPQPQTTIRIFMDYKPLEQPINIEEPELTTPDRNGFTVVEWGGALHE